MTLFTFGTFKAHSGDELPYKIDLDYLTGSDWDCIARIIASEVRFSEVIGIPRGGTKLAEALEQFKDPSYYWLTLVVDDVLTTGNSLEEARQKLILRLREEKQTRLGKAAPHVLGYVVFSRVPQRSVPNWVRALFYARDEDGVNPGEAKMLRLEQGSPCEDWDCPKFMTDRCDGNDWGCWHSYKGWRYGMPKPTFKAKAER
jgi:hypothetical protein